MSYKCYACGFRFDEPVRDAWEENIGNGMYMPMNSSTCPNCGSDEIEEVDEDE